MILTDSHTHLYAEEFDADRASLLNTALEAGVTRFFMPNIDSSSVKLMMNLRDRYSDHCFPMMGLHPCSVKEDYKEQLSNVEQWLGKDKFYAVGEIGMDLYWDKTFIKEQEEALIIQISWAMELNLPIVLHCRESFNEVHEIVSKLKASNTK